MNFWRSLPVFRDHPPGLGAADGKRRAAATTLLSGLALSH